jgi:hypothetical protein
MCYLKGQDIIEITVRRDTGQSWERRKKWKGEGKGRRDLSDNGTNEISHV